MDNFKLGILIPLKARKVAQNWQNVESALLRVLTSINNQTSSEFECVVVGHDEPEYAVRKLCKNAQFVPFKEFEPPDQQTYSGMELQLKYEFDRCSKIAKGMMFLNNFGITHWFALDADDLLHSSFVKCIENLKNFDAIVIDKGYFYFENRNVFNKAENFSSVCGSSCVIKSQVTYIPNEINKKAYREMFYGQVPHMNVKEYFKANKLEYHTPEERLVIYMRDHGDNISNYYFINIIPKIKKWIKLHIKSLVFTEEQYQSFGLKKR